jgi:hypothetical protein
VKLTRFGLVGFFAALVLAIAACRSTEHTVARIVTPTPGPFVIEVVPTPEPATPRPTAAPAAPQPTPTPTVVSMPVVTAAPGPPVDRSPGVLYEGCVL